MRQEDFSKRATSCYKASARVGADGFHPKVLLDLSTDTNGNMWYYWQTGTLLFFVVPKNVTSEWAIALLLAMVVSASPAQCLLLHQRGHYVRDTLPRHEYRRTRHPR